MASKVSKKRSLENLMLKNSLKDGRPLKVNMMRNIQYLMASSLRIFQKELSIEMDLEPLRRLMDSL